jgi:hypothetical protein
MLLYFGATINYSPLCNVSVTIRANDMSGLQKYYSQPSKFPNMNTNFTCISYLTWEWYKSEKCNYSETSIHRFRPGSEKETMDPGKQ